MQAADDGELNVEEILAQYRGQVAAACPAQLDLATEVASRVGPANWRLEWYLPWWLTNAFGLDRGLGRQLVLSNLLGLVSIRLQDDLVDGELAARLVPGAGELAAAAYDEALRVYRARFGAASPFWPFLEGTMATWRSGSNGTTAANRGAPLKIGAYACALLAGRMDVWPVLDRCLDHAVSALVQYDQFCDWESDLGAGRWNSFVAGLSPSEQSEEHVVRNRSVVLTAMLTRSAVTDHFDRVLIQAKAASALEAGLGITPLQAYLAEWTTRTAAQGTELEAHYRRAAAQATQLMFGAAIEGGAR